MKIKVKRYRQIEKVAMAEALQNVLNEQEKPNLPQVQAAVAALGEENQELKAIIADYLIASGFTNEQLASAGIELEVAADV